MSDNRIVSMGVAEAEREALPVARIVQETDGTSGRSVYCTLHAPDGSTSGGLKGTLERWARSNGWRVVFVPLAAPSFRLSHGL